VIQKDLLKHEVQNINAWLFSVTRNHCYKKLNKQKKNPLQTTEDENLLNIFMENNEDDDLLDKLAQEDQFVALEKAINLLKDEQKECIDLFYLKQMSYQQINEQTGIELKKVKSHIQNGKRNLKLIMEKDFSNNE
jgi:RNA polymerase sigma-70 factor (ECF subfamily)